MKRIMIALAVLAIALLMFPAFGEDAGGLDADVSETPDPVVTGGAEEEPAAEETVEPAEPEWTEEPTVEELPAEEAPVEELPAEELPVEETPAEETPEEMVPFDTPAPAEEPEETAEPAPEEEPEPVCMHEHQRVVYYFDSPDYVALDDVCHRVTGRATVDIVCEDCGEVLSRMIDENAEEIRPHVFRKGKCALCGREGEATPPPPPAAEFDGSMPPEMILTLTPLDGYTNQYACTLTGRDLEEAGDTLVLRPEGRDAAIVLKTVRLREEMDATGGTLTAEIGNPGERNINASVRLYNADGTEVKPAEEQIFLRIYGSGDVMTLTVSYTDAEGETGTVEAGWDPVGGYWDVSWRGDGSYKY